MRRGFSNIAAMLSAFLALAAVHQTYAQNALRVSFIFPTASAPNPFKLAPGDSATSIRRRKVRNVPRRMRKVLSSTYRLDSEHVDRQCARIFGKWLQTEARFLVS